jgi:hypothetical protein
MTFLLIQALRATNAKVIILIFLFSIIKIYAIKNSDVEHVIHLFASGDTLWIVMLCGLVGGY